MHEGNLGCTLVLRAFCLWSSHQSHMLIPGVTAGVSQHCKVIPSVLSVMSVTFWPFCALLEWPPLETESLASEPLSCSSWLSSGPGTFTKIVFCRLLVTVLKKKRQLIIDRSDKNTDQCHLYVEILYRFQMPGLRSTGRDIWLPLFCVEKDWCLIHTRHKC